MGISVLSKSHEGVVFVDPFTNQPITTTSSGFMNPMGEPQAPMDLSEYDEVTLFAKTICGEAAPTTESRWAVAMCIMNRMNSSRKSEFGNSHGGPTTVHDVCNSNAFVALQSAGSIQAQQECMDIARRALSGERNGKLANMPYVYHFKTTEGYVPAGSHVTIGDIGGNTFHTYEGYEGAEEYKNRSWYEG